MKHFKHATETLEKTSEMHFKPIATIYANIQNKRIQLLKQSKIYYSNINNYNICNMSKHSSIYFYNIHMIQLQHNYKTPETIETSKCNVEGGERKPRAESTMAAGSMGIRGS